MERNRAPCRLASMEDCKGVMAGGSPDEGELLFSEAAMRCCLFHFFRCALLMVATCGGTSCTCAFSLPALILAYAAANMSIRRCGRARFCAAEPRESPSSSSSGGAAGFMSSKLRFLPALAPSLARNL